MSVNPETSQSLPRKRPAPRGTAAYPRKRAIKACQVCRARRTKCDNQKPSCSFCLKVGAKCNQSETDLSSFDPASLRILERIDDLESLVREIPRTMTLSEKDLRLQTQNSSEITEDFSTNEPLYSQILPLRLEDVLLWPELEAANKELPSLLSSYQEYCFELASDGFGQSQVYEMEYQYQKILLDRFFTHTHVKNPVLDEVHTRQIVSRMAHHGIDWTPQACLALLVCALGCLAAPIEGEDDIGYGITPNSERYRSAQSFFLAAQKRLGICSIQGDIVSTQCLFLAGVYMATIFRPVEAWRLFLQALASCQTMPFVRAKTQIAAKSAEIVSSPDTPHTGITTSSDGFSRFGGQTLEHAIYWSAWKSELELRLELRPQDFELPSTEISYPVFFPTPPNITESSSQSTDGLTRSEQQGWFSYLSEISLRRLTSRIRSELLEMQNRQRDSLFLEVLAGSIEDYQLQAEQWYDALPSAMRFDKNPRVDDICKFVLRGHYNNLHEVLFWPFVDAALHAGSQGPVPLEGPSLDTHDSAVFLTEMAYKGLSKHVERIQNDSCGYRHRHHGSLPMIRSNTRSALVLIAAAVSLGRRLDITDTALSLQGDLSDWRFRSLRMPSGWKTAVASVIDLNRYWKDEAADAQARIAILEHLYQRVVYPG